MTRIGHRCIVQPRTQWLLPDVRRDTRLLPKKQFFCPWLQWPTKPLLHRDHHPALWAFDDSIRQQPLHSIFEDGLLAAAIERGGTTLRDFIGGDGQPGYFQQELFVYGRGGEGCKVCGTQLREVKLGQRASVFCPRCQR